MLFFHPLQINICPDLPKKNHCVPRNPMANMIYGSGRRARQKRDNQRSRKGENSRLIQATALFASDDKIRIRRASEQTSPQVARAVGRPRRRDRAADWAVAAAQSAVVRFRVRKTVRNADAKTNRPATGSTTKKAQKGRTDRVGRLQRRILPKGR